MPIFEVTTKEELKRAFPVMNELRDHLDEATFLGTVDEMMAGGYRLFALEDEGDIVALAGVAQDLNFYYGRFIYVYDLITSSKARSRGYGRELLSHIEKMAKQEGCGVVALSSALFRKDAHRFYEDKMGYERVSYAFVKQLDNN